MRNPDLMHGASAHKTQLFHMNSMDTMLKGRGMERRGCDRENEWHV